MGRWYVVAHVPAPGEGEAFNGVESYDLGEDGTIRTTYVFRDGGFDGEVEVMQPNAVIWDEATRATWGMKFSWWLPRFEYLITYLDEDYETTIVARTARDYAWIMSRDPELSGERFERLRQELVRQGYDESGLRRVPQRWPDPALREAETRARSR